MTSDQDFNPEAHKMYWIDNIAELEILNKFNIEIDYTVVDGGRDPEPDMIEAYKQRAEMYALRKITRPLTGEYLLSQNKYTEIAPYLKCPQCGEPSYISHHITLFGVFKNTRMADNPRKSYRKSWRPVSIVQ